MPLPEVVRDVESVDERGDVPARLIHRHQFVDGLGECRGPCVHALQDRLRHRVLERAGTDRMPLRMIGVQEGLG